MKKETLSTLEFNKIINLLEEEASCEGGRALCHDLVPLTDLGEINRLQTETADALSRIFKQGNLGLSGTSDIRGSIKHLDIGGSISASELLKIANLLETAGRAKSYSRGERESDESDSLSSYFAALEPLSLISGNIRRCIISEEEIADDASSG
ncbi:MAG: endonuclease MutS2, partial [Lachnospiraceae bacterium]|nr:endonuclease MutS2 [Lachnospiraceae bacterium]